MILCVNANAAIDKTVVIAGFRPNAMHRPDQVISLPGGKGCNVARVLKVLGETALVTGWVGGHAGDFIEAGLEAEGLPSAFVRTAVESRTCLTILDPQKQTATDIYEKGEPLPADAAGELYDKVQSLLGGCRLVVLSGSLPPGIPADFYAKLAALAASAGVPAFLDASGEALRLGLEQGRPALIKPNREEFATLAGSAHRSARRIAAAAARLAGRFGTQAAVSLGAGGLVLAGPGLAWRARPPSVEARSAVGSGDALLAGLACARVRGLGIEAALRLAVACGTANTLQAGAGRLSQDQVDRIAPQVEVEPISLAGG